MKKLTLFLILIIAAISLSAFKCGKNGTPDWKDIPNGTLAISRETFQRTASGARVFSKSGLSPHQLTTIDNAMTEHFTVARADGLTLALHHDFYEIFIPLVPCQQSPIQRVWSFRVRADNYDGTEFDQHNPKGYLVRDGVGVVFAAEMVVSFEGQAVICPNDPADPTKFFIDHIALGKNPNAYKDGLAYFYASLTHTTIFHSLLPRGDRLVLSENLTENKIILDEPKEFSRAEVESFAKELNVELGEKDSAMKGVLIIPVK